MASRNDRRKAARNRKSELKAAVADCLRLEAEREANNQRLLEILSIPIETKWSSRGSDKYARDRSGRVQTQGGVRKFIPRDKEPNPMLKGEKRKPMIGKNLNGK